MLSFHFTRHFLNLPPFPSQIVQLREILLKSVTNINEMNQKYP